MYWFAKSTTCLLLPSPGSCGGARTQLRLQAEREETTTHATPHATALLPPPLPHQAVNSSSSWEHREGSFPPIAPNKPLSLPPIAPNKPLSLHLEGPQFTEEVR